VHLDDVRKEIFAIQHDRISSPSSPPPFLNDSGPRRGMTGCGEAAPPDRHAKQSRLTRCVCCVCLVSWSCQIEWYLGGKTPALPITTLDPSTPTEAEAEQANLSSRQLATQLADAQTFRLHIENGSKKGETVVLPRAAVRLLFRVLTEMAQGNAVTLVPIH